MDNVEPVTGISYRSRNADGKGRAVLFVHGAGGNKLVWLSMTRKLAALMPDRPLHFLDLPGHGASRMPGRGRVEEFAKDLARFIEELRLAPLDLVGHSMGGAISLTMSLERPELIRRLAIVSSGYALPTAPAIIQALEADFEGAMRMVKDIGFGKSADPLEVNTVLEGLLACNPETAVNDFKACSVYNIKDRVGTLVPPLAVFVGTEDYLTSEPRNQALAAAVPDAEFHRFEGSGHMLQVERPAELAGALAEYFSK